MVGIVYAVLLCDREIMYLENPNQYFKNWSQRRAIQSFRKKEKPVRKNLNQGSGSIKIIDGVNRVGDRTGMMSNEILAFGS